MRKVFPYVLAFVVASGLFSILKFLPIAVSLLLLYWFLGETALGYLLRGWLRGWWKRHENKSTKRAFIIGAAFKVMYSDWQERAWLLAEPVRTEAEARALEALGFRAMGWRLWGIELPRYDGMVEDCQRALAGRLTVVEKVTDVRVTQR